MSNELVTIIDNTDIKSFQATMKKIEQFQQLIRRNLKEGKDYGTIPGTPKPSLWKPGAEKIVILGKLRSTFEVLDETKDWENEFFQFEIRWNLWSGENLICQGVGLCSSKEDKYRYRWLTEKKLPKNANKDNLLCKEKSGKYGKYNVYRVENEDVCSIANTILKMAKKRALIDAALLVGSLSDLFTQDIEDLPEEYVSKRELKRETKQEVNRDDEAINEVEVLEQEQAEAMEADAVKKETKIEVKPASQGQIDYIYGFKNDKGELVKGIVESTKIKKAEIDRIGKREALSFEKADKICKWWWGNKDKNIVGEREKREKSKPKLQQNKGNVLKQRGAIMQEVLDLMKENYIKEAEKKKMYGKYQKKQIQQLATEELEELKVLLQNYVPDWK